MGQQFGQLLQSEKGSDVNFEVDGEIFAAHKLILAARSPVFRAQLFGPMKDQDTRCIKVEDMEAPVFKVRIHAPCVAPLVFLVLICYLVQNLVIVIVSIFALHMHCSFSPSDFVL